MKTSEKGVTLVELLAALTILSIVMLLVSSVHLFAQNQMYSQSNDIQIQSDERLAMNLITKEIRRAQTVEVKNPNELTINGVDIYMLEGNVLKKNNVDYIYNIKGFYVSKLGASQVNLKIGNLPETTIYIRE
ncbi:PilW family protein [Mesobacillus subterraneus]|uniref:PilW family protein n=1 Tax=Mesobacillus subterraneus TaxID=285983 RepID=UPI001CFCAA4C|nr:prepilin-type N-terminal cleavage/methylation domain-containing protein [Mesobacillus subterraneus]